MSAADAMAAYFDLLTISPLAAVGGGVAAGCLAGYGLTRVPELLMAAVTAGLYAVVGALPFQTG